MPDSHFSYALAVDSFLPNGNIWIWRQISDFEIQPSAIYCRRRENEGKFDHTHVVTGRREPVWRRILRNKLALAGTILTPKLDSYSADKFLQHFRKNRYSFIHAHFGTVGAEWLDLCRRNDIPLVVTFHGFDLTSVPFRWKGYRRKLKELFDYCGMLIAISNDMAEKMVKLGCNREKIRVSYLGVPLDAFPLMKRERCEDDDIVFVHIGRLVEKKGVPDLIKAFKRVYQVSSRAKLKIIGSGDLMNHCKKIISEEGLEDVVTLMGSVPSDEVSRHLKDSDVFVLNSRKDSNGTTEGLPISILEASATGLPIVSTLHAGIPEAVVNGRTGLLVDGYDNSGLSEAMVRLLKKDLREEMGQQGRRHIEKQFDLKNCNRHLKSLYQQFC